MRLKAMGRDKAVYLDSIRQTKVRKLLRKRLLNATFTKYNLTE